MKNNIISCEENRRDKREEVRREYVSPEIEVIDISFGQSYLLFSASVGETNDLPDMPGGYW
jgi:hypothetical protein